MSDSVQQQGSGGSTPEGSPGPVARKRFHNGWTKELEVMFADWADKAQCYRWMHEKTERIFKVKDQSFMFPIIILSTVTGAANFALDSVVQGETAKTYAQLGLGTLSILTGILTTIANRLGFATGCESHRVAAISWGKFNRLICIELALHPNERMDSIAFMKMFRTELDRLIEQSPSIPDGVISSFIHEFKHFKDIKKPEIAGEMEHTKVFQASNERLKKIAQEAALTLSQKKGLLKQMVMDDLDAKVRVLAADSARNFFEEQKAAVAATVAAKVAAAKPRPATTLVERQKEERATELKNLAQANVVASLKERFATKGFGAPPTESPVPPPTNEVMPLHIHTYIPQATPSSKPPSRAASIAGSEYSTPSRGRGMARRAQVNSTRPSVVSSGASISSRVSVPRAAQNILSSISLERPDEIVVEFDTTPGDKPQLNSLYGELANDSQNVSEDEEEVTPRENP